jgi:hypothetical protein
MYDNNLFSLAGESHILSPNFYLLIAKPLVIIKACVICLLTIIDVSSR